MLVGENLIALHAANENHGADRRLLQDGEEEVGVRGDWMRLALNVPSLNVSYKIRIEAIGNSPPPA